MNKTPVPHVEDLVVNTGFFFSIVAFQSRDTGMQPGIEYNYTLYKNAGFWLFNSRDIFIQIQALHCEFSEFLLHVGVFA
jgi:hypothetical protein